MKKIFLAGFTVLMAAIAFTACDPQENKDEQLGKIISADQIKVTVTKDSSDPNLYHFKLTTPSCLGVFSCPEAGINKRGVTEFSQQVAWANDYILNVQVYNTGGLSDAIEIPFSVDVTDPTICENEMYKLLTGGCDTPNGKSWRIKGEEGGHIGLGPDGSTWNEWWAPGPFSQNSALYDDDMIFILNPEQQFILKNYGGSLMNESTASLFPDGNSSGSFVTTGYTPADNASWSIVNEGGTNYLVLTNGFPAYAVDQSALNSGKYKIFSLTATDLHIMYVAGGNNWHYLLTSTAR